MSLSTPVCFCIFNRPDTTSRVFESIRKARPERLLVVSDGPRPNVADDNGLVHQCRQIIETVDWPCSVEKCYSEVNLGCGKRMATGLTWAFEKAERLIILEDDCLPDMSFFSFCEELLERYVGDPRVMMISGDNFYHDHQIESSYYFSTWGHIWGWASWRSAWQHYQLNLDTWPTVHESNELKNWLGDPDQATYWSRIFDAVSNNSIDTWDYSWQYSIFRNQGLVVLPNQNLVSNIGHDDRATHTRDSDCQFANLVALPIHDVIHPEKVARNQVADAWTFRNLFQIAPVAPPNVPKRKKWWQRLTRNRRAA